MNIPAELLYTKTHEWVKELENGSVRIGLTDYAQHALGDLVFVNLPETGDSLTLESSFADVESVKAVSDVFSPVNGKVEAVNEELLDAPQAINESPYDAWLVEAGEITEKGELITAAEYEKFLEELKED
jgi:glycine cleavage system H protein